ncbi:MAG: signal recognition particle protein Srp19 [Candidatus Bathyarchaeota archaeon]|nr:signal recognition particle protein Srp19 [Candidatus Bathyarchaeota archaeon]
MRKQEKFIIWPAYFDQTKTRKEGRRVPKALAVPNPKITEVSAAAAKAGLKHEVSAEAAYPKTPWLKTGLIMVERKSSKEQVIRKVAKQLMKIRAEKLNA